MEFRRNIFLPIAIIATVLAPKVCSADTVYYGILNTRPHSVPEDSDKFCMLYYEEITAIASDDKSAEYFQIADAFEWNICDESEPPPPIDIEDKLAFVSSENNCSIADRVDRVQKLGGAGVVIVKNNFTDLNRNDTNYNFTVAIVSNSSYFKIMETASNETTAGMYSPKDSPFHLSLMIIWILAVFSLSVGAFWSGKIRHALYLSEQCQRPELDGVSQQFNEPQEESSINLSAKSILFFVLMMCTMLLLMYFLFDYFVYMIIGMFCLGSALAMFSCLIPLVNRIPCGTCRTPYFNLYIIRGKLEVREILLLMFCFGFSITWLVMRKASWAWILQDILGIAFSVNVLKVLRLPSLKICTLLLCGLVVYDIFFVFITPLLTSDGKSIMVEVAKGGSSQEQMPILLKVPNFAYYEVTNICKLRANYNLLGFGDILIPGLLVAFTSAFDRQVGTPCHLYYLVNVIGYGSGLVVTFVALYFMHVAQPALLYLVPFTLIPTFITAACRGEFMAMWRGDSEKLDSDSDGEVDDVDSVDDSLPTNATAVPPEGVNSTAVPHEVVNSTAGPPEVVNSGRQPS